MTEITRVYVDMVADLFHYGHVNFLRQAKSHGDFLLVGVHSDETVESLTQLASLHQTVSCTYELNPRLTLKGITTLGLTDVPRLRDYAGIDLTCL